MGDVEPERPAERVPFAPGGQHPLGDVAAAAGLGAGIPDAPPLERHRDHEEDRERLGAQGRREGEAVAELLRDSGEAADSRVVERPRCRHQRAGHRDHELQEVGNHHPPETGDDRIGRRQRAGGEHRGPLLESEQDAPDLGAGEGDGGDDHAVEEDAEIDRAKTPQEGGGPPGVADLVEAEIGQQSAPAPERREDEHGQHSGEAERPPGPVRGHPVLPDQLGDQIRGVGGEGRSHHRSAEKPPGEPAAGEEERTAARSGEPDRGQADAERSAEIEQEDRPVEPGERHRRNRSGTGLRQPARPGARGQAGRHSTGDDIAADASPCVANRSEYARKCLPVRTSSAGRLAGLRPALLSPRTAAGPPSRPGRPTGFSAALNSRADAVLGPCAARGGRRRIGRRRRAHPHRRPARRRSAAPAGSGPPGSGPAHRGRPDLPPVDHHRSARRGTRGHRNRERALRVHTRRRTPPLEVAGTRRRTDRRTAEAARGAPLPKAVTAAARRPRRTGGRWNRRIPTTRFAPRTGWIFFYKIVREAIALDMFEGDLFRGERWRGRPVQVVRFRPRPGFGEAPNRMMSVVSKCEGELWVDAEQRQVARVRTVLTREENFVAGLFGRLFRGTSADVESEFNGRIWLPQRVTMTVDARMYFFRRIRRRGALRLPRLRRRPAVPLNGRLGRAGRHAAVPRARRIPRDPHRRRPRPVDLRSRRPRRSKSSARGMFWCSVRRVSPGGGPAGPAGPDPAGEGRQRLGAGNTGAIPARSKRRSRRRGAWCGWRGRC